MEADKRNNALTTAKPSPPGKPFGRGNPGRPKGARHRTTVAMEALLAGEGEALTRKAIELALAGDTIALRLCLDRIAPPRKDRHIVFDLPPVVTPADAAKASNALVVAVARGEITPNEAAEVAKVLEVHVRTIEVAEFDARLGALETRGAP